MKNEELFANQSEQYAKFRPVYPTELFEYVISFVQQRNTAWDCATGSGQAAKVLATYVQKVYATDISPQQISKATRIPNIEYSLASETTPFAPDSFDLITVAQGYHWLNWPVFHDEATRVGKNNCVVAIWNYTCFYTDDMHVNELIDRFHNDICGPYWDDRRRYVEEKLETVEFNFDPLPSKTFSIKNNWSVDQVLGYFSSWSAVQEYIRKNNESPIDLIREDLIKGWGTDVIRPILFPVYLRLGRIQK